MSSSINMEWLLIIVVFSTAIAVNAVCKDQNYTATTFPIFVENIKYGHSEDCTFNIKPGKRREHYLEITMHKFNIQGTMPDCDGDYIQILITSSQINLGKYCSNNTHGPFTIYSADGHAEVRFVSDSTLPGIGFQFSFELKPYKSTLGSRKANDCIKSNIVEHTTVLHSTGWPDGYSSAKDCKHVILNAGKLEMRIVVMDLDVNNRATYGCDGQDDYIQIRGKDEKKELKRISQKLCRRNDVVVYRTRYSPVYIDFRRVRGSGSRHRGYVIGVEMYKFQHGTQSPDDGRKLNETDFDIGNKTERSANAAEHHLYDIFVIRALFLLIVPGLFLYNL